jgi:hypothetical protein
MSHKVGVTEVYRKININLTQRKRPNENHIKQLSKAMKGIQNRIFPKELPLDNFFYGVTVRDSEGKEFFLNMGNLFPDPNLPVEALNNVDAWTQHASEKLDEYYLSIKEKATSMYGTKNELTGELTEQPFDWKNGVTIVEVQGKAVYSGNIHEIQAVRDQIPGRNKRNYLMNLDNI